MRTHLGTKWQEGPMIMRLAPYSDPSPDPKLENGDSEAAHVKPRSG